MKDDGRAAAGDAAANVLSVYFDDGFFAHKYKGAVFDAVEEIFAEKYPDMTIEYYNPKAGDSTMSREDAQTKMDTDIMAGKGPDIIFMNSGSKASCFKQAQSGVFIDVLPYIGDMELNEQIIDGCLYNGKLSYVPLSYTVAGVASADVPLERMGMDAAKLSEPWGMLAELTNYVRAQSGRTVLGASDAEQTALYFLMGMLPEAVNYSDRTVTLDGEILRSVMELAKSEYESAPEAKSALTYDALPRISDGTNAFFNEYKDYGFESIHLGYYLAEYGNPVMYAMKNGLGGNTAMITKYCAVSRNAGSTDAAVEYMRAYLIAMAQNPEANYCTNGFSVCDMATDAALELCGEAAEQNALLDIENCSSSGEAWLKYWVSRRYYEANPEDYVDGISKKPLSDEYVSAYYEASKNITGTVMEIAPYELIVECMKPYLTGDAGYEECASEAQYKLELYLSE